MNITFYSLSYFSKHTGIRIYAGTSRPPRHNAVYEEMQGNECCNKRDEYSTHKSKNKVL